jgi:hypothetical protein
MRRVLQLGARSLSACFPTNAAPLGPLRFVRVLPIVVCPSRPGRLAGLVYVAAFAPDKGESVNTLIADPQPGAPVPPILPPRDGYLFLDRDKFHDSFAGDLPADEASFMADSQVPWGVNALDGTVSDPGWRFKPS